PAPVIAQAPVQEAAPVQPAVPAPGVQPAPGPAYYANCTAVRAAGAAPIRAGQPGYRAGLDRDGDGIGCE
ncbi:MAG: excalibur calcium-binding domain-containing protein, partial [Actinomycetota bacterium]|nr:excalibur calcium-binding domain-containing protein [Actinomycetota bacterium]